MTPNKKYILTYMDYGIITQVYCAYATTTKSYPNPKYNFLPKEKQNLLWFAPDIDGVEIFAYDEYFDMKMCFEGLMYENERFYYNDEGFGQYIYDFLINEIKYYGFMGRVEVYK